ncbi:MAG: hypothetical protein AB7T63_03840 [Planctomycetota bacterium]
MAYSLSLSPDLVAQGWKVKIRDRERCETPHVSVLRRISCWRVSLRDLRFLDVSPDPSLVPGALLDEVRRARPKLTRAWNRMYPENPV